MARRRRAPGDPGALDEPVSDEEQAILDMVLALKRNDGFGALAHVEVALRGATGNHALEARVLTWWAQALRLQGDIGGALARLDDALSAAQRADDAPGIEAIRALQIELEPLAPEPRMATKSRGDPSPIELAVSALDAGELKKGEILALGAHRLAQRAQDPREQVLSLLALARVPHRTTWALEEAFKIADETGDAQLVTAVAKAARAVGKSPGRHVF